MYLVRVVVKGFIIALTGVVLMSVQSCYAQKIKPPKLKNAETAIPIIDQTKSFNVQKGIKKESVQLETVPDSIAIINISSKIDSLALTAESYGLTRDSLLTLDKKEIDSLLFSQKITTELAQLAFQTDSLNAIYTRLNPDVNKRDSSDSTLVSSAIPQELAQADSTDYKKSLVVRKSIIRDSIPISRLTLISVAVPGFAQIYEGNYWKAAVGYVAIGVPLALSFKQNKEYKNYKREYDALIMAGASRSEIDPVQTEMIKHNTYRQLLWAGAVVSYMSLLADGVANYPSDLTSVKKATTLSMIFPGAGQFYNKSYWRIPFVVGAFATMAYIVDWNNRGYQRFRLAYNLVSDGNDSTVDEFNGRYSASFLKNLKNQYRRNRDLAIIGMAGVYLLNVIDAHVDAHLKDFDVSDDLTLNISPEFSTYSSIRNGLTSTVGLNLNFTF